MKDKRIAEFELWSDEKYCMEAVKRDGDVLQYVKEQSEAICMEAVKQNGYALQYVNKKEILLKIIEMSMSIKETF